MLTKNTQIELSIHAISTEGSGIGRIGNLVVFVAGAMPGDVVLACVVKSKERFAHAEVVSIIRPSADRVVPPCPAADHCGGCQWQHCAYNAQLVYKKQIVTDALTRIGGIAYTPIADVAGMAFPWEYRNKAIFHVDDKGKIGMYAQHSRNVVEIDACYIVHPAHIAVLHAAKACVHRALICDVTFRVGDDSVMVSLKTHAAASKAELSMIAADFAHCCDTLVINGEVAHGNGCVTMNIDKTAYKLSAASFFQVNTTQAKVLYDIALAQAALDGTQTVIDAHCGVGGIALYAASRAAQVIGVDIEPAAISDAVYNARYNQIDNAQFICGAAEKELPALLTAPQNTVVFLDPPRKGCDKSLLETLITSGVTRIVYISCDPATLARDVRILAQGGFRLEDVRPVDMFPMTAEIEVSCLLAH